MDDQKYSIAELERFPYRVLQLIAKSMALPSNFKKIYLIQLIHAKTNMKQAEVDMIVQQVKWERQLMAQGTKKKGGRKVGVQAMEVSSTNPSLSPPIDLTPKRTRTQSPDLPKLRQSLIKHQPRSQTSPKKSDRVLRSYNMRRQRPNYSVINDSLIGDVKAEVESSREAQISIMSHKGPFPRLNVTAQCVTKKYRPSVLRGINCLKDSIKPFTIITKNTTQPVPAIRKRTLSGIYPIIAENATQTNYKFIQSIGFRRTDGKLSKINALVQKPTPKPIYSYTFDTPSTETSFRNVEVTIQDIINSNIDAQTFTNPNVSQYMVTDSKMGYMPALTDVVPNQKLQNDNTMSVYYHKKIRAEQVRNKSYIPEVPRNVANEHRLPKIHDVFSKFNNVKDFTQPLYVQVSAECERLQNFPTFVARNNSTMLEGMYNFKNELLTNQPLLRIATTANTRCVFSTPVITTAVQQTTTIAGTDPFHVPSFEQDNQHGVFGYTSDDVSQECDLMHFAEQDMTLRRYHEALNTSNSSLDTQQSQEATIPEMVEDALEIISQDGDYMERIGMDVRMQCVLCSWAGPKIILEIHIRKEHSTQIQKQVNNDWIITYKLGSLVNQDLWLSSVCERDSTLYALSVKYEDPDCFMCSISTLQSDCSPKVATITVYNKVTGEPFTWNGKIEQVNTNMPYENGPNCLKIRLSNLELLPNSANVKLHSRSLVLNSPSKVVIGQPELNDIHIIIFVKIENV